MSREEREAAAAFHATCMEAHAALERERCGECGRGLGACGCFELGFCDDSEGDDG